MDSLSSKDPGSDVVVLFTRQEDAIGILDAAKRRTKLPKRKFHWVASDGWGSQSLLVEGDRVDGGGRAGGGLAYFH